jgi:hypothetical protein
MFNPRCWVRFHSDTKREKQILGTQMTFHNNTDQIKKLQREEREKLKQKNHEILHFNCPTLNSEAEMNNVSWSNCEIQITQPNNLPNYKQTQQRNCIPKLLDSYSNPKPYKFLIHSKDLTATNRKPYLWFFGSFEGSFQRIWEKNETPEAQPHAREISKHNSVHDEGSLRRIYRAKLKDSQKLRTRDHRDAETDCLLRFGCSLDESKEWMNVWNEWNPSASMGLWLFWVKAQFN